MTDKTDNVTNKQVKTPKLLKPANEWPLRMVGTILVLSVIVFLAGTILFFKNDVLGKQLDKMMVSLYDWCGKQGMVLSDVVVSGRGRTSKEDVEKAVAVNRGDNMLKMDIYGMKTRLEELPWVQEAVVRRSFFPNVLNVELVEKQVKAIWQINEKFYPLDSEGKIINAEFKIDAPILLIVGAGAPDNFKNLMEALRDGDKDYIERVKVANFISGRRWNLILDDIRHGVTIKLPEEDIAKAWKKLVHLDEKKGIFKRKLTIIDLRLPNKVIVKLRKGVVDDSAGLAGAVEHRI